MKYLLDPEHYNFNPSGIYPELHDYFGPNTFIKPIAANDRYCWYMAVKINKQFECLRYQIYKGVFEKNKPIGSLDWPDVIYFGLITNKFFAEELLKHLMGTIRDESVETIGKERLEAKDLL